MPNDQIPSSWGWLFDRFMSLVMVVLVAYVIGRALGTVERRIDDLDKRLSVVEHKTGVVK